MHLTDIKVIAAFHVMPEMSTISSVLKKKASGPYQKALKVTVVALGQEVKYKSRDGSDKKLLSVAISDGDEVIKCVIYDTTKFSRFKVGNSLVLRDLIKKEDGSVVVTSATKVYITAPLSVPPGHEDIGMRILNPAPAPEVKIQEALNSPPRKKISISGKITQEEEPRQVTVRDEAVTIKTITVVDDTGTSKVTLWREAASSPVRPGDHVAITDVVVNHYNNNITLQTTNPSKIKKLETPEEERLIIVEAISISNGVADVLTPSGENLTIPAEILQQAIGDVEEAVSTGPFTIKITSRGSDVSCVEKVI